MKEELIKRSTALFAKSKGFNFFYSENLSEPRLLCTQGLLQKWLREEHDIHVEVLPRYHPIKLKTENILYSWAISRKPFDVLSGHDENLDYWIGLGNKTPDIFYHIANTYEEALEFAIYESLKLIP